MLTKKIKNIYFHKDKEDWLYIIAIPIYYFFGIFGLSGLLSLLSSFDAGALGVAISIWGLIMIFPLFCSIKIIQKHFICRLKNYAAHTYFLKAVTFLTGLYIPYYGRIMASDLLNHAFPVDPTALPFTLNLFTWIFSTVYTICILIPVGCAIIFTLILVIFPITPQKTPFLQKLNPLRLFRKSAENESNRVLFVFMIVILATTLLWFKIVTSATKNSDNSFIETARNVAIKTDFLKRNSCTNTLIQKFNNMTDDESNVGVVYLSYYPRHILPKSFDGRFIVTDCESPLSETQHREYLLSTLEEIQSQNDALIINGLSEINRLNQILNKLNKHPRRIP